MAGLELFTKNLRFMFERCPSSSVENQLLQHLNFQLGDGTFCKNTEQQIEIDFKSFIDQLVETEQQQKQLIIKNLSFVSFLTINRKILDNLFGTKTIKLFSDDFISNVKGNGEYETVVAYCLGHKEKEGLFMVDVFDCFVKDIRIAALMMYKIFSSNLGTRSILPSDLYDDHFGEQTEVFAYLYNPMLCSIGKENNPDHYYIYSLLYKREEDRTLLATNEYDKTSTKLSEDEEYLLDQFDNDIRDTIAILKNEYSIDLQNMFESHFL